MSKLKKLPDRSMEEKYSLGGSQNHRWLLPSSVMEQEMVKGDPDVQSKFLLNFSK